MSVIFMSGVKTDQIEILEQVPVLHITESLYNAIENSIYDLPGELLEMIHKRAYTTKRACKTNVRLCLCH